MNLESSVQSSGRKIMYVGCHGRTCDCGDCSMFQNAAKGKAG